MLIMTFSEVSLIHSFHYAFMSQTLCRAGGGARGIRSQLFYFEGLNLSRGTDMAKKITTTTTKNQEDCNACGIGPGREQKGQTWSRWHLS